MAEVVEFVGNGTLMAAGANGNTRSPAPGGIGAEIGGNSAFQFLSDIYVGPALYPRLNAIATYSRMKRSDAQVRGTLRGCQIPVLGAEWYIEPASTEDIHIEHAELVEANLAAMTTPWSRTLENALSMLDFGSSVNEIVWEIRKWRRPKPNSNSRDMVMMRKLAFRPQHTVSEYMYDSHGGPAGIKHVWVDYSDPGQMSKEVEIPIDKLCIFVYDQEGGDLTGQSILRSAYKHWYMKDQFYKIDGIQKERHGIGVPLIKPPIGYGGDELVYAQNLGRNLRANENAFIVQPPGWEIGFAKLEGNIVDALESARHHDMMIARNVLLQFINAGAGDVGGSRASSATQYDLFLKSLRHVATLVADGFNQYVIPKLINWNYDTNVYPKLRVRGLGESRDATQLAAAIKSLIEAKALTPDDQLEKYIREALDFPNTWKVDSQRQPPKVSPGGQTQFGGRQGKDPTAAAQAGSA